MYYLGMFLVSIVGLYARQKYSRSSRNYADIMVYVFITGVIAMGVFWAMSGFNLRFNTRTILYAVIFASMVLVADFLGLLVYRYLTITQASLCGGGLSLTLTLLSGMILFSERITFYSILRLLLLLAAEVVTVLRNTDKSERMFFGKKSKLVIGYSLQIAGIVIGLGNTLLMKYFAIDSGVTDANAMCFATNVVMTVMSAVILLVMGKGKMTFLVNEIKGIRPFQYGMIILSTVSSNVSTLLNMLILATSTLSYYAPISGALGLIAVELVAVVFAKEKPNKLPIALAIAAALLGFFE